MLVLKAGAPTAISIAYLDGGADLSKNYLDFFDETAVLGCSMTCNWGDSCGAVSTITSPNVSKTSTTPFEVTYK